MDKRKKLTALLAEIRALVAVDSATEEQRASLKAKLAEAEKLKAEIAADEENERQAALIGELESFTSGTPEPRMAQARGGPRQEPATTPGGEQRIEVRTPEDRAIMRNSYHEFRGYGRGRDAAAEMLRDGMFIRAASGSELMQAQARQWLERRGYQQELRDMAENSGPDGGYLVPSSLDRAIIRNRDEYGLWRRVGRIKPMSTDTDYQNRWQSGLTVYYPGEGGSITASSPKFDQVKLQARTWATLTKMSNEFNEDAIINAVAEVTEEVGRAFAKAEDENALVGDGSPTYGGMKGLNWSLLQSSSNLGYKLAATSGHDAFSELDATDLATLIAGVAAWAKPGSMFACSSTAKSLVFDRLNVGLGGATMAEVGGRQVGSYQGYPIMETEVMTSDTGDISGEAMIAFGNPRLAGTLGDRRQISIAQSEHRYFETNQLAVRATQRADFNPHDFGDTSVKGAWAILVGN